MSVALIGLLIFGCRHCLWIVGNATTLSGSGSIWGELVQDAVERRCFFDWDDGGAGASRAISHHARLIGPERGGAASGFDTQVVGYEADTISDALGSLRLA